MISKLLHDAITTELNPGNFRSAGYLGMSMIGGCPTAAYDSYMGTRESDMRLRWYGFAGRAYEDAIRNLLSLRGTVLPKEHYWHNVVANFDHRYRGHADILLIDDGELVIIDVKTLDWYKYKKLRLEEEVPYSHEKNLAQLQAYMSHVDGGGYGEEEGIRGCIIYTPRDIPHSRWESGDLLVKSNPLPFTVIDVQPNYDEQYQLDMKARGLLRMIDNGERPVCTCGWCEPNPAEDEIPF